MLNSKITVKQIETISIASLFLVKNFFILSPFFGSFSVAKSLKTFFFYNFP